MLRRKSLDELPEVRFLDDNKNILLMEETFKGLCDAVKENFLKKVERKEFKVLTRIRDSRKIALKKVRRYARKNNYTNVTLFESSVIDDLGRYEETWFLATMYM